MCLQCRLGLVLGGVCVCIAGCMVEFGGCVKKGNFVFDFLKYSLEWVFFECFFLLVVECFAFGPPYGVTLILVSNTYI